MFPAQDIRFNPEMVPLPASPVAVRRNLPMPDFRVDDYDVRNLHECPYVRNVPVENRPVETVIVLARQGIRQLNGADVDRYEFSIPDDDRIGNVIGYQGGHMAAIRRNRRVLDCHGNFLNSTIKLI